MTNPLTQGSVKLRLTENADAQGNTGAFFFHNGVTDTTHIGTNNFGSGDASRIIIDDLTGNIGIGALPITTISGEQAIKLKVPTRLKIVGDPRGFHAVTNNRGKVVGVRAEAILAEAADTQDYQGALVVLKTNIVGKAGFDFIKAIARDPLSPLIPNQSRTHFRVNGIGDVFVRGTNISQFADYAEYFCGTVDDIEIPIGTVVSLEGEKIRPSEHGDEKIIGAVRPRDAVAILGDADWDNSRKKYLYNDYGAPIYEDIQFVTWTEVDENGNQTDKVYRTNLIPPGEAVPEDGEYFTQRIQRPNPDYDPNEPFVPKEERPECYVVGLLGKVPITKGQLVADNWIKVREVSDTVELWLLR